MADKIQLPNGAFFPVKEGESKEQALAVAQQMYPDAFQKTQSAEPKQDTSGFKAAASAGATRLGGEFELLKGKLGVKSEAEAQKEYEAAQKRAQERFTPTEKGFTEAPFLKFKELLGGSVPYMAAPAAAGLAALAAPVAAPVAAGLGLLGASAVSAGQFTGSNLAAQVDTGKTLEEASLGKAVGAAIPQALIDTAAMALLPGVGKLFSSVGSKLTAEQAKAIASQTLARTAADYTAKTGLAMGREGITEVAQQALERLQAGLEIADPEARKEYIDSFIGGAVLGGTLAPVGRAFERSGAKSQAAAEDRKTRLAAKAEEQRLAAEADAKEEAFRNSPDYALKVADDYAAAEKAKAALLAQKRTVVEGSPTETADKAFNTIITKQLQAQAPELKALGDEYVRLEPFIKQATEQKRIAALTPEEYSLEQMQADVAGAAPRRTRDERLAALNQPIEQPTDKTPETTYAEERLALAKEQMGVTVDVGDYVNYLLTNPRMAQAIVENQTPLAGLDRKEQNVVRGALKLQLQAIEKQRAAVGKAGTAASQARVGTVEEEEQAAIEAQRAADEAEATRMETERADAQRNVRLAPEVEGIKRLGKVPEGAFSSANADAIFRDMYLKQADEERVDQLLSTLPMSSITTPGKIYAGLGFETASRRDLLTRIAVAKAHTGTEDVAQLREALAKLDAEAGSKANMSERLPGEGLLPEAEKKTIAAEKLADQQSRTLQEYIQFLEDKKRGKPRGTLRLGRKERLETAGDEFKAAYAKQHVDEVNARLDAFGLPQLTETEAKIATGRVMRNLNELGERWTASSAAAPGLGTFAAPVKAMEVLQEQIRSGMFKTINDAAERANLVRRGEKAGKTRTAEGGARIATPDELKLRAESTVPKDDKRIATELATQLRDTLDQRTYARPEQPAPKGKEGSNRADMALAFGAQERGMRADIASRAESLDEDTKDFVRLAADTLDQIEDKALITRLKEGLQDVAEGRKVSALTQQELKDFVATRAKDVQSTTRPGATPEELQRTSAQPQMSLAGFDEVGERTQRATPKNFQKMLDSKDVQGMRAAIAKMRTDNLEAIQEAARNTPAALRAARTAKARVAYNAALAQEQKNSSVVSKLKAVFTEERAGAREVVDALQNQLVGLQKRIDEVAEVRSMLGKETNDMALMIQAPSVLGQEKALQKRLKETQTALDFAKDLVVAVDKQNAASATLYDMLTKEVTTTTEVRRTRETGGRFQAFEKQQRRVEQAVEDARKELGAAERAEREAAVEVKETKSVQSEFRDAAQRAREGLDLPGLRSTVDTTKMRTQISNIRSAMGSLDAQLNAETDPVKKAAIQAKIDATAAKLETVYADAPRITTAIAEKDQLLFEQTFDDVHIAAYDKQMAKARIKGGEYGPALANRRRGAAARAGNTARIVQTGEKKATPASEMAGSALERVAQERAALRELEDRVNFLRTNGKDKVGGRLTEAFKTVQEKVAAQKVVVRETEEAQKATVAAVRDINKEERAEKARVRKAEVKAEDDGVVFRTTTRGGPTLATEEVSAIADRITADWKNAPEIVVVATENELPLRILGLLVKREATKNTPGLFDIPSGKVYLIASNLRSAQDVVLTVAHEATGHFGLRDLLGGDYTRTMDNLYAGNPDVRKQADAKLAKEPALTQQIAVEEVLADMAETGGVTPAEKSALRRIYEVLRNWFRTIFKLPNVTDAEVQQLVANARKQVIEGGKKAEGVAPEGGILRRTKQTEPANALESLAREITAQPLTLKEKLGNNLALQTEMQAVDMRAGLRETLRFGDDSLFTQAMYHVRKAEQKMAQMFTVMNSGPLVAYKDAKGFIGYRSSNENSARDVFDAIADIPVDDPQLKTNIAQAYLVAIRANNKGLSKLDMGELGVTQEALDAALAAADADPALKTALENVRRKYNAYNKGLIEFLASTGRISKKAAADLLKDGDYVPYYRVRDNGMAELNFGNNVTFNVGDIRRQPYLAELKGGQTKLLPLNEAIQQNTLLLTDMALTNNAAKSVAYGLQALGKGMGPVDPITGKPGNLMPIKTGPGPADARTIRFFQEPDPSNPKDTGERHLIVNTKGTAAEGIPAELVVQSLEGASLALPGFFKLGGAAADLLRAGVTRTPLYIARKLIREPMAAAFTGGLNSNVFSAVFKAGAEFVRMSRGTSDAQAKLIEKGLIQSNIFAGDMSDMKKMALQLASGKDQSAFDKVLAAADRYAMRADAATLALVLKNAEENGLSEVEADMMTMESMNFYKRGLSPTLQYASRLIPFFNAQIQGLSVLIKAARGNMPFEEQQQIKRKFFNNAMLLMATGLVYAMAMEDDETFRNARPRDKYSNFFLPIPFVDEPIKLPIPFEAGYFFSLAVAAVDGMRAETDGKAQFQALRDLFLGSIPGYSSMGIPALVKPAFEVWADKNFLTGGSVEPRRLQSVNTEERYLATTTELAKQMSKAVPILSPIQIEHIVRGYLGVLPLVAAAGANSLFEGEKKAEKPESRASELPLIGTAFQKKYGGGDADVVYREAQEAIEARNTFNKMLREGRREDAVAYREENKADLAMASAAGQYRQVVGRINEDIRRTQDRTDLTPQEKRIRLDALDKAKQERADAFISLSRKVAERTS
jgi:hypothetical protein